VNIVIRDPDLIRRVAAQKRIRKHKTFTKTTGQLLVERLTQLESARKPALASA